MSIINDPSATKTSLRIPLDAARLRQARQAKQLTLEEVTDAVSINKMTLLRYETGDIHAIAPERLERLAALYETTPAILHGIPADQEFTTDLGLQLIPVHADPPTLLGRRLSLCLKNLESTPEIPAVSGTLCHSSDPLSEPGTGS